MALEKTVLNEKIIFELLAEHYGISPITASKLKLGTANCFQVYDGTQYYFLKEFQSSYSENAVVREATLLEYLSGAGIPTARFYKTLHDGYTVNYQNHVLCLEEYIDGQTYNYDDLPLQLLSKVGQMLGRLHQALKNYPLPVDMSEQWVESFSAEDAAAQYDALIKKAESKADDGRINRIISDLQYKKNLAVRCEEYKKYYRGITYCSSHGDYQGCQLIFAQDEIKAVVDFSSAVCLPAPWEIMRSFVQSSKACRTNAEIDVNALCEYVREYLKYSSLTENDMIAMPYVYLFQLAASTYGYLQYLESDSEDKEGLLQFALWRTRMCREVEKNAKAISAALKILI